MNAWTVRRLRKIAAARWELRRWAAVAEPTQRRRLEADIEQITTTGELPRATRKDSHGHR